MTPAKANHSIVRRHVSIDAARAIVAGAKAKAEELGVAAAIAIVDADGTLKCFERMDGAAILPVRIAQQKAWTAISMGIPTHAWWEMVKDDPPLLHGIVQQEDVIVFAGGLPIQSEDDEVIGGIGVSGAHYSEDREIAEAGLAAL